MVEKHDLKRAEAEVEVGSAAALPANHLSGTRLAANVHRSVIAFAIRQWNLFGFYFSYLDPILSSVVFTQSSFRGQVQQTLSLPRNVLPPYQQRCRDDVEVNSEGGREGVVDEECPRMLSEGVAPKEGREPVREAGGGRERTVAACVRQQ